MRSASASSSECSSLCSRMKNCSTSSPPASHHAMPTRKGYVPVPPASPVVSVSRKSHWLRIGDAVRRFGRNQPQRREIEFRFGRSERRVAVNYFGKPTAQSEMRPESILSRRRSKNLCEPLSAGGNIRHMPAQRLVVRHGGAPRRLQRSNPRVSILYRGAHEQRRSKMASAASLVRSLFSPAGPTHDGQPLSHGQPAINSCVRRRSRS